MTDSRRYRDMTDEEVENLIGSLPRRAPGGELRTRILSHRVQQPKRAGLLFRPGFGFALVVLLLLADFAVIKVQDRGLRVSSYKSLVAAAAQPELDPETAWLWEVAQESGVVRLALLRAAERSQTTTYLELRRRMLDAKEAG